MQKLERMLLGIIACAVLAVALIGAKPVETVTFNFFWEGVGGYSVQGSFSYDKEQNNAVITSNNLEFLKVAFFDPNKKLLKSYINVENGQDTGLDPYLEFNFDPSKNSLFGALDVGEGNLVGENDFYLHGDIKSNLELRNLDTNAVDSNKGMINVEKVRDKEE